LGGADSDEPKSPEGTKKENPDHFFKEKGKRRQIYIQTGNKKHTCFSNNTQKGEKKKKQQKRTHRA